MLNFGGQTRRRVINLGTKGRPTSKRDIIQRADQERKKRAEDRDREQATRVIQKNIRKRLALARFFQSKEYSCLNDRQNLSQIIVFKSRLLEYGIPETVLISILTSVQKISYNYKGSLANESLVDLISHYKNDNVLSYTLQNLNFNPKYFDIEYFINDGLLPFLKNIPQDGLSESNADLICQLLYEQRTNLSDPWIIKFLSNIKPDFNLFKGIIKYELFPEKFQNIDNDVNILNNICYIDSMIPTTQTDIITAMILDIILDLDEDNFKFMQYSSSIVEKPFIERILTLHDTTQNYISHRHDIVNVIDKLLKISKENEMKNGILMILLAKQSFNSLLYNGLLKINQHTSIDIKDLPAEYRITRELTRLYLQFATDADLLSTTKSSFIPLDLIKLLTQVLKEISFNTLWNGRSNDKTPNRKNYNPSLEIKDDLSLLTQLYLRDSRGHFFSGSDKNFWCITDESFINVDLYNTLVEYEKLFRREVGIGISSDIHEKRNEILNRLLKEQFHGIMSRQFRKLNILIKSPFFIPFDQRVDYFYFLIETDKKSQGYDDIMNWLNPETFGETASIPFGSRSATISRENVLGDAMEAYNYGSDLKAKLSVTFVNEFGKEEGIDGGGVTKEFLTSIIEEGFKGSTYKLFTTNDEHKIYPLATSEPENLKIIQFLGKIVGKCLYDHILVDLTFANFFLKTMLIGADNLTIDDLRSFDSTLYNSLIKLLNMTDEELIAMDLTFETTNMFDSNKVVELVYRGSEIRVNKQNVLQYVWKLSQYKLKSIAKPSSYRFLEGLNSIIPQHWFGMFNTVDLQMLISGGHKPIDLVDLRNNVEYGGYTDDDETIKYFWEVLEEISDDERRDFLKFVTSVPQAPLKGFGALEPKFGIRNYGSYELDRLPTASTCVNLFKLPDYKDKALLKGKLLYSIHSGARFDLS